MLLELGKGGKNIVLVFSVPFAQIFFCVCVCVCVCVCISLHLCFRENEFVNGLTLTICKAQPTHLSVCS